MPPIFRDTFAWVCSQTADRTWAPGGEWLPFCQRCTGLYVGACAALVLAMVFRVRPGFGRRVFDGCCLLQMVPLGFHWIPHGPVVRTISGALFAFGLVDFLWLLPGSRLGFREMPAGTSRSEVGFTLFAVLIAGVLIAASNGGAEAAHVLSWLGFAGLIGLVLLVIGNLGLLIRAGWWRASTHTPGAPP